MYIVAENPGILKGPERFFSLPGDADGVDKPALRRL
jgi:hypothetical protein